MAGALFGATTTAEAACYGSTPSAMTFADSPFDGEVGLAPEITTVSMAVDGACNYSVNPGLTLPLIDDDFVFIYVDRDGNAATGSLNWGGADVVVGTVGGTYGDSPPLLGVWNGAQFTFTDTSPAGTAPFHGGFSATLDRLGVAPGVTTGVQVRTDWNGTYDTYNDYAPDTNVSIPLAVNYSTAPPPPPPPPPPPAPAPAPAPLPSAPVADAQGCTIPNVKGRTRDAAETRLFNADCEVAFTVVKRYSNTIRKGRVIGTSPGTGIITTKRVKLIVSKGRKRARARASAVAPSILDRLEDAANAPMR